MPRAWSRSRALSQARAQSQALPTKEFQLFHDHHDDTDDEHDHDKRLLQEIIGTNISNSNDSSNSSSNNHSSADGSGCDDSMNNTGQQQRRRGTTTKSRRDSFASAAQWEGSYLTVNDATKGDDDDGDGDEDFITSIDDHHDDGQDNDDHDVETNSTHTATTNRLCVSPSATENNNSNDADYEGDDGVWEELLSSAFLMSEEEEQEGEKSGGGFGGDNDGQDGNNYNIAHDTRGSDNNTGNHHNNPRPLLEIALVLIRRTARKISSRKPSSSLSSSSSSGVTTTRSTEKATPTTKISEENDEENNNEHEHLMVGISPDEFMKVIRTVFRQLGGTFGDLPIHKLNPLTLPYYIQAEECKKNFVWKRRKHRGMSNVSFETVHGLNDALFLAQVSFVNTVQDVKIGLSNYSGPSYELVYCVTISKPSMPAHYLAIRRDDTSDDFDHDYEYIDKSSFFTVDDDDDIEKKKSMKQANSRNRNNEKYLEMILAVRGTKTIDDYLSDALLEMKDYRGGKTHNGVCVSGLNVYNKHKDLILRLLRISGREKVRLTLLGHSLGAGAAAIACIEFNENHPDLIEAHSIGFGCPALLSEDLSKKWDKHITTLVNESDMIPRMSGATVANLIINFLEFDYTPWMMDDLHQLSNRLLRMMPQILTATRRTDFERWFCEQMSKNSKRFKARNLARQEVLLFPPGRCLHMYNLPASVQCVEVPCTFFNEFDATSTMVDNHKPMSSTGYYLTLLQYLRTRSGDPKRLFENNLIILPPPANQ